MRTCPYCAAQLTAEDNYIDYGEEWWCSTDCLAGYYEENNEVYDRMGMSRRSIEAAVHRAIVFEDPPP